MHIHRVLPRSISMIIKTMRIIESSSLLFFLLLLLLLIAATLFSLSLGANDILTLSQPLSDADDRTLISAGSKFVLGFFTPAAGSAGNRYVGIWYNNISEHTPVWIANRDRPVTSRSGRLSLTTNGTLILTVDKSTVFWSSDSPAVPLANPVARLHDDGNFIVADDSGSVAWESFNFPTDTVLPGMKVRLNLTSGQIGNITSWTSDGNPTRGDYVTGFDLDGDPQIFTWNGKKKFWRGGPWNGYIFTGIPEMRSEILHFEFIVEPQAVVFSYSVTDASVISKFTISYAGILQHLLWVEGLQAWKQFGFTPRDECDSVSPCGPNGVCDPGQETIRCTCLQGFQAKNGTNQYLGVWSDGCVRKTTLDCRNKTDGFLQQSSVKLPDTSRATVDWSTSVSQDQCMERCLANCSCTAYASANISTAGGGSGCIIWTTDLTDVRLYQGGLGQDLFVRLAAVDLVLEEEAHERSHKRRAVVIISVAAVASIFLVAGGACGVWRRKKRQKGGNFDEEKEVKEMDLPLYDLGTIVDATGNFSPENKLGQGGFGPVYKGTLGEGKEIAVKRLSKTSAQGAEEFKNEAMLIAKLQHRNLVRLLGCCVQGGERMLIYEYLSNGSLDAFLFDETKSKLLDWPTRFNIIVGIARGLLYLHQDSRFRIIHRDMKAGNVLLDKDMKPKISDFGMARIFGGEESEVNTRRVVGTYGYMSPEYAMDGIFSVKSDVFSFGVLILEIITSRRNRGLYHSSHHLNLIGHVWTLWKEDKVFEIVDKSIADSFSMAEILSCMKVGLLCVQELSRDRPTMSSVVRLLGSDSTLLPEPKQPGYANSNSLSNDTDSSTSTQHLSTNNVSMTVLEGR